MLLLTISEDAGGFRWLNIDGECKASIRLPETHGPIVEKAVREAIAAGTVGLKTSTELAARDLLKACKFALAMPDGIYVKEWNEARGKFHAAIAKAEGKGS